MQLDFKLELVQAYWSQSQKMRVLTETWMQENGYCPSCGSRPIGRFANNQPVADFFCSVCGEQYELKSKSRRIGNSIADGAYHTMLERIRSDSNPNFFFLSYNAQQYTVNRLVLVPKHFMTADMIVPRNKGLKGRPDYIMCSINLRTLPKHGQIVLLDENGAVSQEQVLRQWRETLFLRTQRNEAKGWLLAVMKCIDILPPQFTLAQMYAFEAHLQSRFPNNHHVKDKIRQQLQILRDHGIIEFCARGQYRKTAASPPAA
ncbi:DpnI domain-containing protein [Neisseria animalis]|uniref:Restriction endonuclease n=1 Tax=Neisseria animalis TaxID=492 RepID=A0A5P3MTX7_NEIAN|nr:DpnI domain-containing protein [Neisseria animalis]QEY24950.1 restriction endonuclease [Neisseria animalis]ROW32909.1 restriction endonuclease [Neisseria animalis]